MVGDPRGADVAIVNTCAFISSAVDESARVVERCLELKRSGDLSTVVVAGCLPQRYGLETFGRFPDVDGVVGSSSFHEICEVVNLAAGGTLPARITEPIFVYDHRSPRILGTPAHLAYVKIAEGCGNRCTYCTIPTIRGTLRSRDPSSVAAEAEALAASGVRELNLVAQDTTAYGTDIASSVTLPGLLSSLGACGAPWIRVLYAHPSRITDELLAVMGAEECIVPYLDVPVQHVSRHILKAMGRDGGEADVRSVLERVRLRVRGVTIRSSIMVGFPGETEEDFEELLSFVKSGLVDHLGVFEFSPEPGTPASSFGSPVDAAAARERAERVAAETRLLADRRATAATGTEVVVLVDEPSVGRTAGQAWELDGSVLLENIESPSGDERCATAPGEFWVARVIGGSDFDLRARPLRRLSGPMR